MTNLHKIPNTPMKVRHKEQRMLLKAPQPMGHEVGNVLLGNAFFGGEVLGEVTQS